jgi:hypothetical protein
VTTATLVYTATATPPVTLAQLTTAMGSGQIPLDSTGLTVLGAEFVSDTTTDTGSAVTRTLVYTLGAGFLASFPNVAAQESVFANYFTIALSSALVCDVVASTPVIT